MTVKRHPTLCKGKKVVKRPKTAAQLRKNYAKGAPKRIVTRIHDEQAFAKKMRSPKKVKKPLG
jgi:hypothetical protein